MKKVVKICLLIVILALILCACVPAEEGGLTPQIRLFDYDMYLHYVATGELPNGFYEYADDLPEDFVTYEKIEEIGVFESFYVPCAWDIGTYCYFLNDKYTEVTLYLNKEYDWDPDDYAYNGEFKTQDLRKIDSDDQRAVMQIKDVIYVYYMGNLRSIHWEINGVNYSLSAGHALENYPLELDTAIAKLLNADTAVEFLCSFAQK